jgi:hypothetical protein
MCPPWAGLGVSIPAASRRSKRCAPYSSGERGSTLTASSTPPASPTGLAADQLLAPWGRVPGSAASAPVMRRPVTAAQAIAAFSHPGRCRNDAAFASLAGTCPIPASSAHTAGHRLNRAGDRAPQPRHPHHRHEQNARLPHHPGLHRPSHRRRQTIRESKRCLKRYITPQLNRTLTATITPTTNNPAVA